MTGYNGHKSNKRPVDHGNSQSFENNRANRQMQRTLKEEPIDQFSQQYTILTGQSGLSNVNGLYGYPLNNLPIIVQSVQAVNPGIKFKTEPDQGRGGRKTESKVSEEKFQNEFVEICRSIYGNQLPISSDAVPYTISQLRELAKCFRNRLRRINQSIGDTDTKFLNMLRDIAKCTSHNDYQLLRQKYTSKKFPELKSCWAYQPTQDRRTQVPRWHAIGEGEPETDSCKKIYMTNEIVVLFGLFMENRPDDQNIHQHLKDKMIFRKYCEESLEYGGCFNILHLGIAVPETAFCAELQRICKPVDGQEFRDFCKKLHANFAMMRHSSPDDFLELARDQMEKTTPCCFLRCGGKDTKTQGKDVLKSVESFRMEVLKYVRGANESLARSAWAKCDEEHQKKASYKYCINPHHAEIPPNNIQHISDIISQLRKKFNQKLHIVPGMPNSKQKASMEVIPPLTQKFADIYYYRFALPTSSKKPAKGLHMNFSCYYMPQNDVKSEEITNPLVRIKVRPEKTSFYNKNTKIDQSTKRECIDKEASFNLMCKHPQDDRKKCRALYNCGEKAHKQCLDNTARCKVSYLSRRRGVFPKQGEYNFSVCLDRMEIDKYDGLKNVTISVLNESDHYLYIPLSQFELFELQKKEALTDEDCNQFIGDDEVLLGFKRLPQGKKMPCLQFDHEIRAAVNDLDMNKNRRLTKKFPKAYALFNWNKNPETGDPLLKFREFPIEKCVLKDIGIPEFVDICVLDKTCKIDRTEHFVISSDDFEKYTTNVWTIKTQRGVPNSNTTGTVSTN